MRYTIQFDLCRAKEIRTESLHEGVRLPRIGYFTYRYLKLDADAVRWPYLYGE